MCVLCPDWAIAQCPLNAHSYFNQRFPSLKDCAFLATGTAEVVWTVLLLMINKFKQFIYTVLYNILSVLPFQLGPGELDDGQKKAKFKNMNFLLCVVNLTKISDSK